MEKEKISLLQRFIIWRENKIKEKQFILILSFLVGIFTAIAALLLKFFIHTIVIIDYYKNRFVKTRKHLIQMAEKHLILISQVYIIINIREIPFGEMTLWQFYERTVIDGWIFFASHFVTPLLKQMPL